jgi:dGTPase
MRRLIKFTYEFQISSNKLKIAEARGRHIVRTIFNKIEESKGDFLPEDYRAIYKVINGKVQYVHEKEKMLKRTICDFIASMTDNYCIEFYGRLTSENPQTIFKRV